MSVVVEFFSSSSLAFSLNFRISLDFKRPSHTFSLKLARPEG